MHTVTAKISDDMQKAIISANECADSCFLTINYCTHMGGEHANAEHLALLMDCARICETSSEFMLRESMFHAEICLLCAAICDECARSCLAFPDDQQMQECAKKCTACSDSCRQMAKMKKAA